MPPKRGWSFPRAWSLHVIQSDAFAASDVRTDQPLLLPLSPDRIYRQSLDKEANFNPCTDKDSNTRDIFFYYWDPDKAGCSLRSNAELIVRTVGKITRRANTTETFPEYDRLYGSGSESRARELRISVFMGYIGKVEDATRPVRGDEGLDSFQKFNQLMRSLNFRLTECDSRFALDSDGYVRSKPGRGSDFFRVYEKTIESTGKPVKVQVRFLLSNTRYAAEVGTFHYHWFDALAASDVVYFDGHSGLGGALDLKQFRKDYGADRVEFKSSYQILFFNACSSTPYFVPPYLKAKGGSRELDILSPAIPSLAETTFDNAKVFLLPFLTGATPSWQKILDDLEESNYGYRDWAEEKTGETYLFSVTGDEDNQWRPFAPLIRRFGN